MSHVLFDFFGTLVDYDDGHARSPVKTAAFVSSLGQPMSADELTARWDEVWMAWETRCAPSRAEFSMLDVARSFLPSASPSEISSFVSVYIAEWNAGVRYLPGLDSLLRSLSQRHRLAVVSNTHEPDLVPFHLAAMGVLGLVDTVVTSVEVGVRKPAPEIYSSALDRLGIRASSAVFVGDNPTADYFGPLAVGMRAFLIDPAARHTAVPPAHRLSSVFDLPSVLL
ncbi:putative hydrolase of the HAD superfamily [Asanoa hainanensis]|uniref:Putative hydrolase of the HAD superfamily n=1 Tax=Asanoa hainanensis TaxID=560556 RepID=A0A239LHS3_9ACTN|nr:HAD family hydrolase [Asanoa hainanensis]SNT29472.1 putative hydrolase of the HAD superfamily [Asanoa hainanensis]